MIKVGQIYKDRDNDIFVITYINNAKLVSMLYTNGSFRMDFSDNLNQYIKYHCEFLAEYPTWQEAVNSKEFNDE